MATVRNTVALAMMAWALAFGASTDFSLAAQMEAGTTLPGPLVTPQWLHDHLNDVTVIDLRDDLKRLTVEPKFNLDKDTGKKTLVETGGHIPGALSVEFTKIREERVVDGVKLTAMLPTKEFFEHAMADAGLDKGMTFVITPIGDSVESLDMATRLFFQLKYFGDDNIAILNGGTNAWISVGYPISTDSIGVKKGNWAATAERKEILATTEDVKKTLQGSATQLVDARPTAQYFGIAKSPVVLAAGHVQGARSFPTEAVSRSANGAQEFMSANAYRAIFKQQNISSDLSTIAYCNTGHLASGAWFVAHEILNNKNAKLYAGSMNEWTHLKNPVIGLPE
jgi:thiosulfate/3-mercaptopyruvate sulfurtransferase